MSAAIDVHTKKKVLMIAANPGTSPTTGWPVGFWWAELTHPWWTFTEAGYEVEIVSPRAAIWSPTGSPSPRMRPAIPRMT